MQVTPRLQCLLVRTLPYGFNVRYINSSTNQVADCLSKLGPLQDRIKLFIFHIHELTCRLHLTARRIQLLHEATEQNDDLCLFKHIVQAVCPSQMQEVPLEIQPYLNSHEEIYGLLLKCTKSIAPTS